MQVHFNTIPPGVSILNPQFNTDTNWSQFPPITAVSTGAVTKCYAFIIE